MGTVRSRGALVLLVFMGLGLVATACGEDEAAPPAARELSDRLAILKEQQGFTDGQVRCVTDAVEAALDDEELKAFADELTELERTASIDAMSPGSRQALTDAIADCAVEGG